MPPINYLLPAEIVGEIFLNCIPPNPLEYPQPDTTIAPMALCHICSLWREIALNTPHLWQYLYYVGYMNKPRTLKTQADLAFLTWWMDNAKDVPIALRLQFERNEKIERPRKRRGYSQWVELGTFLEFLGRLLSNARYLHLDSESQRYARQLQGLDCPKLDTIVLRRGGYWHSGLPKFLPVNPKQRLRRVSIQTNSMDLDIDDLSSNLNFSLITHLHLCMEMTLDVWFSLLQRSVNLVYGSFAVSFGSDHSFDTTPAPTGTILPHLQRLAFENFGCELDRSFLEGVHLPSLVSLTMDHFMPPDVARLHRILSSTPNLRALQLKETQIHVDPDQQISFIIDGDLDPANPSLPGVVPYLSSIHISYHSSTTDLFVPANSDVAIAALTGPWLQLGRPGNCLSSIVLSTDDPVMKIKMEIFTDHIQGHVPAGVNLSVVPYRDWDQNFTSSFGDPMLEDLLIYDD